MSDSIGEYKRQDVKFVEWSRDVTSKDYDVERMIERICALQRAPLLVLDVGGGIGTLAKALVDKVESVSVDVIDCSPLARDNFISQDRISLVFDDFLSWNSEKKYDVIIFRTVLHHLVGPTEEQTEAAQGHAIEKAGRLISEDGKIFVTENFYDPVVSEDITGKIIFHLTQLKTIASVLRGLGANTAGEGVRFRSFKSWERLFRAHSYKVIDALRAPRSSWYIPVWQRAPLLCADCYQALVELKRVDRSGC